MLPATSFAWFSFFSILTPSEPYVPPSICENGRYPSCTDLIILYFAPGFNTQFAIFSFFLQKNLERMGMVQGKPLGECLPRGKTYFVSLYLSSLFQEYNSRSSSPTFSNMCEASFSRQALKCALPPLLFSVIHLEANVPS